MAATAKPDGLVIQRNGLEFTLSWKVMDRDYSDGQEVQYRTNLDGWKVVSAVTAYDTSATVSFSASELFPSQANKKLTYVQFCVRGKREEYSWSGWSYATKNIKPPRSPSVSVELGETYPQSIFSWDVWADDSDAYPCSSVEYEAMLIASSTETDGSKLTWSSSKPGYIHGTVTGTEGSRTITEDSATLADGSYTRWFRARARGVGGESSWRYAKHVYAKPKTAVISQDTKKTYARLGNSGTTNVRAEWTSSAGAAYPIDRTEVQWVIGVPGSNLTPPTTGWDVGATVLDSAGTDVAQFVINDQIGTDECLWVRVANFHDVESNPSISNAVMLMAGTLNAPEFDGTVSVDQTQRTAQISFVNNSEVPDSHVAVVFFHSANSYGYIAGIADSASATSIILTDLEPWETTEQISFGLYAFRGDYDPPTGRWMSYYITDEYPMMSAIVMQGGDVPLPPSNLTAAQSGEDEAIVKWSWDMDSATQAEISWSANKNAWESTSPPDTFVVNKTSSSQIRVTGLTGAITWYFRVRFIVDGDTTIYGPYSSQVSVSLTSEPQKPILQLSGALVSPTTMVTASWSYINTDETNQGAATLQEVTANGTVVKTIKGTGAEQYCSFRPDLVKWNAGTIHYLRVRVTSSSGLISEWSDPVPITVADPVTCTISATSLEAEYVIPYVYPDSDLYPSDTLYPSNGRNGQSKLTTMPLTATVIGAGAGGITTLAIERLTSYSIQRPDGSASDGYEGETIALFSQTGESQISIGVEDLIGSLDDGAWYKLVATVQDGFGQSATEEINFVVAWSHQAIIPTARVEAGNNIAVITVDEPEDAEAGDSFDIYRLSAEKPELVISGGTFGEQYVDPYPAIGEFGGHRVVYKTFCGDYITGDNRPAWIDFGADDGDYIDGKNVIVDFDGNQVELAYNIDIDNRWEKDFKETKYLGGAIQGDWNKPVSRQGTITSVTVAMLDQETIILIRKLARYTGMCHVRTPDGFSFSADVQVSERSNHSQGNNIPEFTLQFTAVDRTGVDGLTFEQWNGGGR